jgi:hypothetical protein
MRNQTPNSNLAFGHLECCTENILVHQNQSAPVRRPSDIPTSEFAIAGHAHTLCQFSLFSTIVQFSIVIPHIYRVVSSAQRNRRALYGGYMTHSGMENRLVALDCGSQPRIACLVGRRKFVDESYIWTLLPCNEQEGSGSGELKACYS